MESLNLLLEIEIVDFFIVVLAFLFVALLKNKKNKNI